jgi:hypothetical protein
MEETASKGCYYVVIFLHTPLMGKGKESVSCLLRTSESDSKGSPIALRGCP